MPIAKPIQPNTTRHSKPPHHYNKPPLIIVLTIIILIVFFIGFCALYFCKCFLDTLTQAWNRYYHNGSPPNQIQSQPESTGPPPVNPGLEPEIINSFPSFPFSSVKDLREEKYSLECAICLHEFEEEHVLLRLLTTCYHVFHQECIDRWLQSNKTCPVCRRNLDPNAPENNREVTIEVLHENIDENLQRATREEVLLSRQSSNSNKNERKIEPLPDKFSRSKTTGHSIVRNKPEEEDRYRLRLPDHVKIKVARRFNNQTESCISFGELMRNRGGRFGEVSGQSLVPK